jgi:2-polyprenyl-3-methyl-5-hydroxy-6-metoxy-1,4-benzoquinol methylase
MRLETGKGYVIQSACSTTAPPCDACGAHAWQYLFSESGFDLRRCAECRLHYVAQMPNLDTRMTEMDAGHFADDQGVNAATHHHGEAIRSREFQVYVDMASRLAPTGKWLDIGCGTGTLVTLARRAGKDIEGIELTADRRALARQATGATIHEQPIEHLGLEPESFAVVTLINVFSHLTRPSVTLSRIRQLLSADGIVVRRTGEIGGGVRKNHMFSWELGDHLYFLGEGTIETYRPG